MKTVFFFLFVFNDQHYWQFDKVGGAGCGKRKKTGQRIKQLTTLLATFIIKSDK
jgi:hypothetical protein